MLLVIVRIIQYLYSAMESEGTEMLIWVPSLFSCNSQLSNQCSLAEETSAN